MADPAPIHDPSPPRPPRQPLFNRFPLVVGLLTAAIVAVTAVQLLGSDDLWRAMIDAGAVIGGSGYSGMDRPLGPVAPLFLHVFLHVAWWHLLMNMMAMIAFAPAVALALGRGPRGAVLFLGFFFLCAAGGGLAQYATYAFGPGGYGVGASSALSGLLPALGWLQGRWSGAVRMSSSWVVINLILAATSAVFPLPIAWAAHLGGLAAGLAAFPLFLAMAAPPRRDPEPRGPWG